MKVFGKVTGMSQFYKDGLERMYIEVKKREASSLPYEDDRRVAIDLVIGNERYRAGVRTTPSYPSVWISPDLNDGTPKLAEVLVEAGFRKNQSVILEVEGQTVRVTPSPGD